MSIKRSLMTVGTTLAAAPGLALAATDGSGSGSIPVDGQAAADAINSGTSVIGTVGGAILAVAGGIVVFRMVRGLLKA